MAWIPIAAAVISGAASLKGGKDRNVAASAQSQAQMDFQERMSSTAHAREVADLRRAGLNPILSATGGRGASSPGGAQAPMQDVLTPAVNSALATRRMAQEIKNLKASEAASLAQAALTAAQADVIAPRATVGSLLNDSLAGVRGKTPTGGLFDGFQELVKSALRGGTASAREAERARFRLELRNPVVSPPKRTGGK